MSDTKLDQTLNVKMLVQMADKALAQGGSINIGSIVLHQPIGRINKQDVKSLERGYDLVLPSVSHAETLGLDDDKMAQFKALFESIPQPRVERLIAAAVIVAMQHGRNDRECGNWLGWTKFKFQSLRNRLHLPPLRKHGDEDDE